MKTNVDVLAEIPCFKCLFWEWKKDSHLYCNPKECQKLTEWLLKQVESYSQIEDKLVVATTPHSNVTKNSNHKPKASTVSIHAKGAFALSRPLRSLRRF
jgi:hypothetical protein